jgi:hypothetical protein
VLADPRTPCIGSFDAGAGRCSPPSTPCIGSFHAGTGRCSSPRTPCICSSGAGARRCSPPRTPCICSFHAGAGRELVPPHSLHLLCWRWCWQMLDPPALLACAPDALVRADARPPHSLHVRLWHWCGQTLVGFLCSAPPAAPASSRLRRLLAPPPAASSSECAARSSPSAALPTSLASIVWQLPLFAGKRTGRSLVSLATRYHWQRGLFIDSGRCPAVNVHANASVDALLVQQQLSRQIDSTL